MQLIEKKLKASKEKVKRIYNRPNHHVVFGSVQAAKNPEYAAQNLQGKEIIGQFPNKASETLKIEEGNLPEYEVKVI